MFIIKKKCFDINQIIKYILFLSSLYLFSKRNAINALYNHKINWFINSDCSKSYYCSHESFLKNREHFNIQLSLMPV